MDDMMTWVEQDGHMMETCGSRIGWWDMFQESPGIFQRVELHYRWIVVVNHAVRVSKHDSTQSRHSGHLNKKNTHKKQLEIWRWWRRHHLFDIRVDIPKRHPCGIFYGFWHGPRDSEMTSMALACFPQKFGPIKNKFHQVLWLFMVIHGFSGWLMVATAIILYIIMARIFSELDIWLHDKTKNDNTWMKQVNMKHDVQGV